MSSFGVRRFVAVAVVVAAGCALPVVTAGSASASPQRCEITLHNNSYIVGPQAKSACKNASAAQTVTGAMLRAACTQSLVNIGVRASHASDACYSY